MFDNVFQNGPQFFLCICFGKSKNKKYHHRAENTLAFKCAQTIELTMKSGVEVNNVVIGTATVPITTGGLQRVKRNPGLVLRTRFTGRGFCEWYLRFGCPKHDPEAAPDRLDSV